MIRYKHTNLIAKDWKQLAKFYQTVFNYEPLQPERDLSGDWVDELTNVPGSHITGAHLRLPGFGGGGPTIEIFQYNIMPELSDIRVNTPGFSHIAFEVDNVEEIARKVFMNGGKAVGKIIEQDIPGVGQLSAQYVTDPEGNIIEIQNIR